LDSGGVALVHGLEIMVEGLRGIHIHDSHFLQKRARR